MQNYLNSFVLAPANVVPRPPDASSVSLDPSSTISKTSDSVKMQISTSKSPSFRPSRLGVIKQSIRDRNFSQYVTDFVSKSRRKSTQKVYDAKWTIFSHRCRRKKVNLVSAPIKVIADFFIFLFPEKKYQISTI